MNIINGIKQTLFGIQNNAKILNTTTGNVNKIFKQKTNSTKKINNSFFQDKGRSFFSGKQVLDATSLLKQYAGKNITAKELLKEHGINPNEVTITVQPDKLLNINDMLFRAEGFSIKANLKKHGEGPNGDCYNYRPHIKGKIKSVDVFNHVVSNSGEGFISYATNEPAAAFFRLGVGNGVTISRNGLKLFDVTQNADKVIGDFNITDDETLKKFNECEIAVRNEVPHSNVIAVKSTVLGKNILNPQLNLKNLSDISCEFQKIHPTEAKVA
jgi:hypothetical protein